MTPIVPAPWDLKGKGYMFLYKFPEKIKNHKFSKTDFLEDAHPKGFGTVMLVNYHESTAGPYYELLFIPGRFNYENKKYYSITKIYVSSQSSVENGQRNWGIPKEIADFSFEKIDKKREKIIISKDGTIFFEAVISKRGFRFPITTKIFPLPLIQRFENTIMFTQFNGRGWGTHAKIESMKINDKLFPDISSVKPLTVKKIDKFNIEFPVAETKGCLGDAKLKDNECIEV